MSYSFNLVTKRFTKNAQNIIKRVEKSPYLSDLVLDGNVNAEFISKDGKLIRMVIKPDGSYSLTSFAPERLENAICSEYLHTEDGMVMKDVLRSIEKKVGGKKSKTDILLSRDFTQEISMIKQYVRNKGEKVWTAVKRVF